MSPNLQRVCDIGGGAVACINAAVPHAMISQRRSTYHHREQFRPSLDSALSIDSRDVPCSDFTIVDIDMAAGASTAATAFLNSFPTHSDLHSPTERRPTFPISDGAYISCRLRCPVSDGALIYPCTRPCTALHLELLACHNQPHVA